ncbi:MAG TPA: 30S ribosome-binding factor RbfA [Chthoniobacterales bacterium]|jgi:ribosome-binding factor A
MKYRLERVCEVLKRELGVIMGRELKFSSPLVTVSGVDITPDLKQAHVFMGVIGNDNQRREAIETLTKSRAMLQSELAKRIVMKHTPHLNFKLDEALERGTRVISIMNELGLIPDQPAKPSDEEPHV